MLSREQYEKDAAVLRKAMEGWGTDEKPIIEVTAKRSMADRQQIIKFYKSSYGRDLIEDLDDELGGCLCQTVLAMYKTPIDYDCSELNKALKKLNTDEDTLIEIIGTRSMAHLTELKARYLVLYKKELEKHIVDETGGDLKRLLVSILQCNRDPSTVLDKEAAMKDLKALYDAGEGQWGTDESVFNKIFAERSAVQLKYINEEYSKHCGKTLFDVIDSEFSGDIKKLLKTILHALINPTEFFAERIRWACKGMGTNDDVLIRVLVTRDEIDLKQIKGIYQIKYGMSLYEQIKDETSGDYKNMLLAIAQTD